MIDNKIVLDELQSQFSTSILESNEDSDMLCLEIQPESLLDIMGYIKNKSEWELNFLTTLCATHYPESSGREIAMMYQLYSMKYGYRLRIKSFIPIANPTIDSLTSLFPSANWQERQEYDFFGVQFKGHPDLRRILNMDEMDYFPMRKEYVLEDDTRTDKEDSFFGR
jgi:NADH-quinone oxidoreductase subunit C